MPPEGRSGPARRLGVEVAFRVYGKARPEPDWHIVDVLAMHRRNADSRWPYPFWRGTCITWTATAVAVGWDFAETVLFEQAADPATRERPVEVRGGRLRSRPDPRLPGTPLLPTASEVLAHECGHTSQARRMGLPVYWVVGACFTLWREGPNWYNRFENEASATGLFGGIVSGSVHPRLMEQLRRGVPSWGEGGD
jgi:hypothetical protein